MQSKTRRSLIAAVLALAAASASYATTSKSLVVARLDQPAGAFNANRVALTASLVNGYDELVHVTFEPLVRDGLTLEVTPRNLSLTRGEGRSLLISGAATKAGKQPVFLRAKVTNRQFLPLPDAVIEAHMAIVQDAAGGLQATLGTYQALFVLAGRQRLPGLGFAYLAQPGIPSGPQEQLAATASHAEMPAERLAVPPPLVPKATQQLTVKGEFRWIDVNGNVRSAWGWRAALDYWNGSKWVDTGARGTVGTDAKYTVSGTVPLAGYTRVSIYLSNRYFDLVNGQNQKYFVALPQFATDEVTYNYGAHYIDLNQSVAPGVGELHRNAYDLWDKLTTKTTTSPLRTNPIKIVFPINDDCGSCSLNGTVHVAAINGGTDFHTIRHELGHELMYQQWGGMPAGSGGYHVWPNCANMGLALSEGFAHFLSWWSTIDQVTLAGNWGTGYYGESLPNNVCKTPAQNELRVAAALWDLHDAKIDGIDDYVLFPGRLIDNIFKYNAPVYSNYPNLRYGQLEKYGGLEWQKILPISKMNFAN